MEKPFKEQITSLEELDELRTIIGSPSKMVLDKVIYALDEFSREFIAKSPFVMIATSDSKGNCDVSPRGDAPGFVHVIDEKHLFIPERPGNRRMDSIHNILENPHIGLIFVIPGLGETFRVNGKACISRDQELLDQTAVQGKLPLLGIGVQIEEAYMHCAKAFMRSGLWKPESWPTEPERPSAAKMIAAHVSTKKEMSEEQVKNALHESYTQRMY